MIDGKIVVGVDCSDATLKRSLRRIRDPRLAEEIKRTLQSLLFLDLDQAPRKLHLHPLTGKQVQSVRDPTRKVPAWSLHVTADDRYKASGTRCRPTGWRSGRWWPGLTRDALTRPDQVSLGCQRAS